MIGNVMDQDIIYRSTDEITPWKYPSCWFKKSESLFKADNLNKCLTKCKDTKIAKIP